MELEKQSGGFWSSRLPAWPSGGPGEHPGLCPSFCFSGGSPSDQCGPGGPWSHESEQVERLKGYWGVDLPPAERYLSWAADVLRGDMVPPFCIGDQWRR